MYAISTTPGDRVATADTIPDALAALASQLTTHLPNGPVSWKITDPAGTEHRGYGALNGRLDLLTTPSTNSSTSCTPNCIVPPTADHADERSQTRGPSGRRPRSAG